jgi:16S rRNA (uracil1498-N3)-methyltransferase
LNAALPKSLGLLALMADRYFVERPITGPAARLVTGEAHHLAHVMRGQIGDEVTLFDGSGAEFAARVERVGRADVEVSIISRVAVDRELPLPLTLGVALPKGDRQRWLAEKSTELGVARLVPLLTEHGNVGASSAALEKLRRAVIEACKQCGRNRLMEIAPPRSLDEFLSAAGESCLRLIAHSSGMSCPQVLDASMPPRAEPQSIAVAIGPEGGFTGAEIDQAKSHDWHVVDLGPRILRVETAALALTSAIANRVQAMS